jgi:hypothetical protein
MTTTKKPLDMTNIDAVPILDTYGEPDRVFNRGDIAKHFKGNIIQFVGFGRNTETLEDVSIYSELTASNRHLWVRPTDMFLGEVDHEKYPDVKQKYRVEKVYLEKKATDYGVNTFLIDNDTKIMILERLRGFFRSYNPKNGDRIQVWETPNYGNNSIKSHRPFQHVQLVEGFRGENSIKYLNFQEDFTIIRIETDNVIESISIGNKIHFVGEYRFVVEDIHNQKYEFFEIIPSIPDSF